MVRVLGGLQVIHGAGLGMVSLIQVLLLDHELLAELSICHISIWLVDPGSDVVWRNLGKLVRPVGDPARIRSDGLSFRFFLLDRLERDAFDQREQRLGAGQ